MGETADQLRQEVDRKREDAGQKIDAIEQRVSDTAARVQEGVAQTTEQVKATVQQSVEGAMSAVGDTTQQVAEQVKQTTQQVTEQVKANFDWQKQIEERPLVMLGAAMLGGFVLGSLTGGGNDDRHRSRHVPDYSYGYGVSHAASPGWQSQHTGQGFQGGLGYQGYERQHGAPTYTGLSTSGGSGGSGMRSGLRGVIEDSGLQQTLTGAAAALLGSAGDRIRSTLEKEVPGFADQMKQRTDASQGSPSQDGGRGGADRSSATSDAAGRTAPYYGGHESPSAGGGSSPSVTG
jgi:hypothetical protein